MGTGIEGVSVLVPTLNEELNLPDCLESVKGAGEVFVVDSFSSDRTCEIAEQSGAKVFKHKFRNYSDQKNWAFDNLPWSNEWIILLDADERLTPELVGEVSDLVGSNPEENCFFVPRKFIWMGRWLKHGGGYPAPVERLVRRGRIRFEDRSVNEHLVVEGKSGYLRNAILHENHKGIAAWLAKHNRYSTMEAEEALRGRAQGQVKPRFWTMDPVVRKRYIRYHIWPYLPFKPTLYFIYQYVLGLGFLDGAAGYHYARLKSQYMYWTELKKRELARNSHGKSQS